MFKTPKIITGASNGPEYYHAEHTNFFARLAGRATLRGGDRRIMTVHRHHRLHVPFNDPWHGLWTIISHKKRLCTIVSGATKQGFYPLCNAHWSLAQFWSRSSGAPDRELFPISRSPAGDDFTLKQPWSGRPTFRPPPDQTCFP